VIAEGTSRDLKASVGANALHVRLGNAEQRGQARDLITRIVGEGVLPETDPGVLAVRLERTAQATEVLAALSANEVDVAEFSVGTPSLDEVFLALTGRPADDAAVEVGA
jgi:ABC-2 type transport system ATP-binding protein